MSEFQRIAFRAVDGPVSAKNLEFMEQQSTRAEITPWSFDNEYHYGDFRGNALEMLRRGYDLHLHYANFGVRKLLIRLPHGLPDAQAAKPYLSEDLVQFVRDKQGPGGSLCIDPYFEPGELEELWEIDEIIDRLIPLRAEILDGDLRPLYLAHLAVACDGNHDPQESKEAPVPAGLKKLTDAQRALAKLYGLGDSLIAAAAQASAPLAEKGDAQGQCAEWLRGQPAAVKDAWLAQWMIDPNSAARRDILAEFRKARKAPADPAVRRDRTIAELQATTKEIQDESRRKSAAKAARDRTKRLAEMAANPDQTLNQTERLVTQGTRKAYDEIATLLADLREALAGGDKSSLAEEHARKLREQNPTRKLLVSELRQKGFLPK
jgi:hypothetical protein